MTETKAVSLKRKFAGGEESAAKKRRIDEEEEEEGEFGMMPAQNVEFGISSIQTPYRIKYFDPESKSFQGSIDMLYPTLSRSSTEWYNEDIANQLYQFREQFMGLGVGELSDAASEVASMKNMIDRATKLYNPNKVPDFYKQQIQEHGVAALNALQEAFDKKLMSRNEYDNRVADIFYAAHAFSERMYLPLEPLENAILQQRRAAVMQEVNKAMPSNFMQRLLFGTSKTDPGYLDVSFDEPRNPFAIEEQED